MRPYLTFVFNRITLFAAVISLITSAIFVTPVYAASIVVNSAEDNLVFINDSFCTLREALVAAQSNSAGFGCTAGSGADIITFADNYTITLSIIGQLAVTSPVTIQGKGTTQTIIQAAASPGLAISRVFVVSGSGNLTLENLTVRHGNCNGGCASPGGVSPNAGAGIWNQATLTIRNSTISENTAVSGAGIWNNGNLIVENSEISRNTATANGGGIMNQGSISRITGSTFSGNTATASGAGIWNQGSISNITDSTFSSNSTTTSGGGIWNQGSLPNITDSTFSGNSAASGGALYINSGSAEITTSTFLRNSATNSGGGILNRGTLAIRRSTLSENVAPSGGGLQATGGSVNITNSTFSSNIAQTSGGGILNDQTSTITVTNSTFYSNSALNGGGVSNGATLSLRNTIVANSPSGGNCAGTITNNGSNLDSGATCGFGSNNGSMSNTVPNLSPLSDNGGPTQTHALVFPHSPAIGKAVNGCPATDQRGVRRPTGAACDIGAYETFAIVVNTHADTTANDGLCSLREAITAANLDASVGGCETGSESTIDSIRVGVNTPITLNSQLPAVSSEMIITGEGPANTIVQANASPNVATYRVFEVAVGGNLTLNQLAVRHGRCNGSCATNGTSGGGIYSSASLTVNNSLIAGNNAVDGGGIHINSGLVILTNSTFSGNSATDQGGGIYNGGLALITNSTLAANVATNQGGGIYTLLFTNVTSSTLSGNSAATGGGIFANFLPAVATLRNTIVANSPSGGNCAVALNPPAFPGFIINNGGNLDSGTTCLFGSNQGSKSNTNPNLGPLADNGGPTPTMALLAGSPAINAGVAANCQLTDQRGGTRPAGTPCDIGAFEFGATVPVIVIPDPNPADGPDTTGVFRPSNGLLYLKHKNETGFADVEINYGIGGDYPVVGDWDGDGDVTIGIYRNGSFYLRNSNTIGIADVVFPFGAPGDQPVAGDWNGDGIHTIGVYRNGTFFLRNTNDSGAPEVIFALGGPGDVGITGDWNNDGFDTTGVFRPSNGALYLKNQNTTGFADIEINYGLPGDKPVTGDWDGDGDDTIGVYRNGEFLLRNSNTIGFADIVFALGIPGDHPIAGNWDGQP